MVELLMSQFFDLHIEKSDRAKRQSEATGAINFSFSFSFFLIEKSDRAKRQKSEGAIIFLFLFFLIGKSAKNGVYKSSNSIPCSIHLATRLGFQASAIMAWFNSRLFDFIFW